MCRLGKGVSYATTAKYILLEVYALQNKESQTQIKETSNNALKNQSASYDRFVQKSEAARLIEESAKAEELAKKLLEVIL